MNFKGKGPWHGWWWQSGTLAEHEVFADIVGDNWLALRPGCELVLHPQLSVCSPPLPTLGMPGGRACLQCFAWEVDRGQWGRGSTDEQGKQCTEAFLTIICSSPGGLQQSLRATFQNSLLGRETISSSPSPKGGSVVINSLMLLNYTQVKLKWFSVGIHTTSAERARCDLIQF